MHSLLRGRSLCALAGVFLAINAPAFAAAQVEEFVVGPANAGGSYSLSASGGRVAYVGMKGTKPFVSVDGVESPAFDEIFGPTGQSFYHPPKASVLAPTSGGQNSGSMLPVIFSADGAHYAFVARLGNDYVVIHDGKEIARGPRELLVGLAGNALTFSPGGRHVYWNEAKTENGRSFSRLLMSGKPGPWSGNSIMKPVFSADEARYAYNAAQLENYHEQMLVVDGKTAGYDGRDPQFTADGKALLSVRYLPTVAVLLDGKPVVNGLNVDKLITAPAGRRWGAIVRTKIVNGLGVSSFFLEGKEVSGTEGAKGAWFSPDGKHYAVSCVNAQSKAAYMVVDGKPGREFQGITDTLVTWTPDQSRIFYAAVSGGRNFLVVNDEVLPVDSLMGYKPIVMPPVGNRYGFATYDGTNRIFSVMIEGKPVLLPGVYPVANTLTFSADGSRYGYFFGPVGRSEVTGLALDGVAIEGLAPINFGKWLQMDLVYPSLVFSRDGQHVAYLARGADPKAQGLYLDGKLAFPTQRVVYFPSFTPDGQHLLWATPGPNAGNAQTMIVYVDGREAVRANGQFFSNCGGVWSMDDKGVLTFFAAVGDAVKRYRIMPSADTSLATMVADVATAQAKALAEAEAQKKAAAAAAIAAKADEEVAAAKAKADFDAANAAKIKARQDALDAKKKAREDALKAKKAH